MQMFPRSDLKLRLTLRVIAASAFCFAAISAFFLVDGDRSVHARLDMIASITARTLELQQNKVQWINQPRSSFPDLQEVAGSVMTPGLCIAYRDRNGAMVQRVCGGPRGEAAAAPYAFAMFYRKLFDPGRETVRPVVSRGSSVGDVVVSVDPATLASEAWQGPGRVMAALALALPLLGALVYMALARALRPTGLIRNGLERIATGDLAARLPPFDLAELSAIRDVFNHLAERLGTALAERNELTRRLIALQDDERLHLARELHDEFGQSLAAIRALAASARQSAAQHCPAIQPECDGIARTAADMMERLRGALFRLRPPDVEQLGLTASLEGLIAGWNSRSRGQTRFEISLSGICDALPAELAANLYRIAQEAITNAAKHAGASRISLAIAVRNPQGDSGAGMRGDIELIVEDDGQSCDRPAGSGLGLLGMRERVAALGGWLNFAARQGGGSVLRAVIPAVVTTDRPVVGNVVTEHAA
ncbi:histidine kinase [Bradyrhizobium sp. ISRA443]|uniref:HAMP domain-containing sensor histidine kinase n=1 Tax=unclassified Bradyrhizobium TaxID=2631580 RepID=UPI00247A1670|nr:MULTISPECIES: histidine kinase [unclassified Bradyrhizobium]WGR95057.1 histidine kinase [Bradyrhizobium sp. ISRA435]WGR99944.1 histidine kinase [Bradyrhizobium sp. ISRA436]WGS06835.1 histidine kinase [Bradyrhizobium sp. ISRA437]WGS13717.1 histidine kinase [Bradyrhizobium sp. ISRA443]